MMPVVPMYDENAGWKLNAIFFTTPFVQQSTSVPFMRTNQWEPVALPNVKMCNNWCEDCGWEDTSQWSTMHIYFSDPQEVTCKGENLVCASGYAPDTDDSKMDSKFLIGAAVLICAVLLICAALRTRRSTKEAVLY